MMIHRTMSCKIVLRKILVFEHFSHHFASMHSRLWNEQSQVYQLDFGGRVTLESAKNFQIEFKGKQVCKSPEEHLYLPLFRLFNSVVLKIIVTHSISNGHFLHCKPLPSL